MQCLARIITHIIFLRILFFDSSFPLFIITVIPTIASIFHYSLLLPLDKKEALYFFSISMLRPDETYAYIVYTLRSEENASITIPRLFYRIAKTLCFSNRGHGLYLSSPTEIQKFSVSSQFW